ncbi:MAG: hypothetical protein FD143_3700, partial [Ignavibacteria bacterium]
SAEIFRELLEEHRNILLSFVRAWKYFESFWKSAEIFCELLEVRGNIFELLEEP